MVDQDFDGNLFEPRHEHQQVIVLNLDVREHVQFGEFLDQYSRLPVIGQALEGGIDRCADDSLVLEFDQIVEADVIGNADDAFETSFAVLDGIENV